MRVVGWNFAARTGEAEEAAEKLWAEVVNERAHLDAECTEDEMEREATWCWDTMRSVLDAMAKKIRIFAKSKLSWDGDIKGRGIAVERKNE
jgi:hypothetical protein